MHERRVQGPGGRWATQQLVSSTPLSAAEAAKLLARMPVGPAGGTITERVSPQLAPGARIPAVGEPTTPPTDGHPKKDSWENTSHRPPNPPARQRSRRQRRQRRRRRRRRRQHRRRNRSRRRRPPRPSSKRPVPSSPRSPGSPPPCATSPAPCTPNWPTSQPVGSPPGTRPPPSACTSCAASPTTAAPSTAPAACCATSYATYHPYRLYRRGRVPRRKQPHLPEEPPRAAPRTPPVPPPGRRTRVRGRPHPAHPLPADHRRSPVPGLHGPLRTAEVSRTVRAKTGTSARRSNEQGLCSVGTHEAERGFGPGHVGRDTPWPSAASPRRTP